MTTMLAEEKKSVGKTTEPKVTTPSPTKGQPSRRVVLPEYQILTKDEAFEIKVALPGATSDGLDIKIEDQWLSVKAHTKDLAWEGFEPIYAEFSGTDYEAGFKLPNGIDTEHIGATLVHGLLTVTLPKAKEHLKRQIEVKAK